MGYPEDWPRCPTCGDFALDGHITCGRWVCDESKARSNRYANPENPQVPDIYCTICGKNWVDAANGFDTCVSCLRAR